MFWNIGPKIHLVHIPSDSSVLSFCWLISNFYYARVCWSSATGNSIHRHRVSSLVSLACVRDVGSGSHKWLPATLVGRRAQPLICAFSISAEKWNSLPSYSPQHKGILDPTKGMPKIKFFHQQSKWGMCVSGPLGSKGEMINHQQGRMTVDSKSASLSILFFLLVSLFPFKMNSKRLLTVESPLHAWHLVWSQQVTSFLPAFRKHWSRKQNLP